MLTWVCQEDMKIAQEEIFGPVMALMKFKYVAHPRMSQTICILSF